jgi:hypothetical protein
MTIGDEMGYKETRKRERERVWNIIAIVALMKTFKR